MNRVSRDLGIIDDLLPSTGFESLEILGNSFGIFILCTALNYIIVLPLLIVLVVVYFAQMFYVDTARKLKRLEGMARSPLFNQLASSLSGLTTIRAYRSQEMFIDRFSTTQDRHTAVFFVFISASRIYGNFLSFSTQTTKMSSTLFRYFPRIDLSRVGKIASQSWELTETEVTRFTTCLEH